jgi:hypothetical protein
VRLSSRCFDDQLSAEPAGDVEATDRLLEGPHQPTPMLLMDTQDAKALQQEKKKLNPALVIAIWIACLCCVSAWSMTHRMAVSSSVIIYNKFILVGSAGCQFPS